MVRLIKQLIALLMILAAGWLVAIGYNRFTAKPWINVEPDDLSWSVKFPDLPIKENKTSQRPWPGAPTMIYQSSTPRNIFKLIITKVKTNPSAQELADLVAISHAEIGGKLREGSTPEHFSIEFPDGGRIWGKVVYSATSNQVFELLAASTTSKPDAGVELFLTSLEVPAAAQ